MILAIDPGLHGALCFYNPRSGEVVIEDMPVDFTIQQRRIIDQPALLTLIVGFANRGATQMWLELVGGRPGQSGSAAFTFGVGYGCLSMAGLACGMKVEAVPPAKWKAAMKVTSDKTGCRTRASVLMPSDAHMFTRIRDDGRAEAALLALYAERRINGEPFTARELKRVATAREAREKAAAVRKRKAAAGRARRLAAGAAAAADIDPASLF